MKITVYQEQKGTYDILPIVQLIHRAFKEREEAGIISLGSRMTVSLFEEKFSNDDLLLAFDEDVSNTLCGVIILSGEKDGYIEIIAISPEYKHQGVGSYLLQFAETVVLDRGGRLICSDTGIAMRSSVKWHLRNGFRRIALCSYSSTDYYSFLFRKTLKKDTLLTVQGVFLFIATCVKTLLTKKAGRKAIPSKRLTLKETQQVSVEIMSQVHDFCKDNNIIYTLGYGSLIGAVRHQGFIPWDDDIDIIMPRPDYDRFISSFDIPGLSVFSGSDPDSYILYSHVCDLSRTFVKTKLPFAKHCRGGVWIDVFPADAVEDSYEAFADKVNDLKDLFGKQIYLREAKARFSDMPTLIKKIGLARRKIIRKNGKGLKENNAVFDTIIRSIPWGSTMHWSQMACMDEGVRMYQLMEDFKSTSPMLFEGKHFMVLNGYDRVLRMIFGDYMELPPENERVPHQVFLDYYWI